MKLVAEAQRRGITLNDYIVELIEKSRKESENENRDNESK